MNALRTFLCILFGAAAGGGAVAFYLLHREHGEPATESQPAHREQAPHGGLLLKPEQVKLLGIVSTPAEAGASHPEITAFGECIEDPDRIFQLRAPLAGRLADGPPWPAFGERVTAGRVAGRIVPRLSPVERVDLAARVEAARAEKAAIEPSLRAARSALERARALNADQKNVSDRAVEEASARAASEEARAAGAAAALALLESADAAARRGDGALDLAVPAAGVVAESAARPGESVEAGQLLLRIAPADRALFRVHVPLGVALDPLPRDVRIEPSGLEGRRLAGTVRGADPAGGALGATLLVDVAAVPMPLRPGLRASATWTHDGAGVAGARVAASAVLRHLGKHWIFIEHEPGLYELVETEVGALENGSYFCSGVKPGARVVTVGAQTLLSQQLKAQIEGDEAAPPEEK